jgi:hypothetical protein
MELQEPIWERQKGERSKAFYLFTLYRDLGPLRTIDKVRANYQKGQGESISLNQLHKYSMHCQWVCRSEAYDDYQDQQARKEMEEARKEMIKRHAQESKELQRDVLKLKDTPEIADLKPTQKAWLLNTTVNSYEKMALLERLNMGESTEKTELKGEIQTEDKTAEKIKDLFKEAEKGNTSGDESDS